MTYNLEKYLLKLADSIKGLKYEQLITGEKSHPRKYNTPVKPPEYAMEHESIIPEIAYLVKGKGIINLKGISYLLKPGDFCIVNSNVRHFESYLRKNINYEMIWFICNIAQKITIIDCEYNANKGHKIVVNIRMKNPFILYKELKDIINIQDKRRKFVCNKEILNSWFKFIKENIKKKKFRKVMITKERMAYSYIKSMQIEKAIKFINEHYKEEITLKEIASQVGLTPSYFGNLFLSIYGKKPFEFIMELRMQDACKLLETTALNVKEVGFRAGYNDPYYFSKIFKEYNGLSPKKYRKEKLLSALDSN